LLSETGKPVRVTSMPRPNIPQDPGTDIAKLEQVAAAETNGGVSSVIWAPDGQQLIFSFKGQFYRVQPGQTPQPFLDSTAVKTNVTAAPRENRVAFISGGDLWVASLAGNTAMAQKVMAISRKDIAVEDFRWSSDGKSLAFIESDQSHMSVRGIPDYLGEKVISIFEIWRT
jgi:Tol biopolymer transport system component